VGKKCWEQADENGFRMVGAEDDDGVSSRSGGNGYSKMASTSKGVPTIGVGECRGMLFANSICGIMVGGGLLRDRLEDFRVPVENMHSDTADLLSIWPCLGGRSIEPRLAQLLESTSKGQPCSISPRPGDTTSAKDREGLRTRLWATEDLASYYFRSV
jgi:hypothetical protein